MLCTATHKNGEYFSTKNSKSTNPNRKECDKIELCEVMRSVNIYSGGDIFSYPFEDFVRVVYMNR